MPGKKKAAKAALPLKKRDSLQPQPLTETMTSGCLQQMATDTLSVSQLHLSAGFQFQEALGAETGSELGAREVNAKQDVASISSCSTDPRSIHTLKFPEFCKNKLTSTYLPSLSQELCQPAQHSQGQKAAPGLPGGRAQWRISQFADTAEAGSQASINAPIALVPRFRNNSDTVYTIQTVWYMKNYKEFINIRGANS